MTRHQDNDVNAVLFAYGTLRDAEICAGVLGRPLDPADQIAARALGYKTVYYPGESFPALIKDPLAITEGVLISGLGPNDWQRLDAFEGAQYRRAVIGIMAGNGTTIAQTYFPAIEIDSDAPTWSLDHWAQHHRPQAIMHYRATRFSGE